jgi:formylglycine-generating enzyme required for sulfatase activity
VVVGLTAILFASNGPEIAPTRDDTPSAPIPPQGETRAPADKPPKEPSPQSSPVVDPYVSKTTGMKFVRIKAGTFTMGSVQPDRGRRDELAYEVTLTKDYYLGMYEVTRGEFRKFVESTGYETEAETDDGGLGWIASRKKSLLQQEFTWRNTGFEQTDDHPVVNVTWNDAVKFAEWLSRKDGRTYRLPTEAEWEYACRGGTTTRFSHGEDKEFNPDNEDMVKYGNTDDASYRRATGKYVSNESDDGFAFTAPVGRFQPNPFGLYDMHGNVWEWCSDWYGAYPSGRVSDPQGLDSSLVRVGMEGPRRVWILGLPYAFELTRNSARISRGGSFVDSPSNCRSAFRGKGVPEVRSFASGFRLAMETTPPVDVIDMPPKPKPKIDTHVSKATGMNLVRIKAGTFKMGLPEPDIYTEYARQHEVTLTQDFYMGVYEVTRGEFRKFVEDTGYSTEAEVRGDGHGWNADKKKKPERGKEFSWRNPGFEQTDDHPVVNVTWNDAVKFAEWLSRKDGRSYRLPTEAEWEYACRGRSTTRFHFGAELADLPRFGNGADASFKRGTGDNLNYDGDDGFAFTAPVGRFRPNRYGLYDMHGNVEEWCSDWNSDYPRGTVTDPRGPETGSSRVIRGGGWYTPYCETTQRGSQDQSRPHYGLGFRLVMEPSIR